MSINIWTDSMQHAALLGKPVLFTNWLIQRDIIPDGWYCYDLRGTHKSPSTRTTLVDHAADYGQLTTYTFHAILQFVSHQLPGRDIQALSQAIRGCIPGGSGAQATGCAPPQRRVKSKN